MDFDILASRLSNTGLSDAPFQSPVEAVAFLGAVQAQDYTAAEWGLGLRIGGSTNKDIDSAYDSGQILRVHVMRPTWHFILPENLDWMIKLTAPRVKASLAANNRKLGLDHTLFAKTNKAIIKALEKYRYLTRQEIKGVLQEIGIMPDVQRLGHIVALAELDGFICSGPRRGKQFTYMLVEDRIRKSRKLNMTEASAELARRYFTSHGPAQISDFAWWSGLAVKDAKAAFESVKSEFSIFKANNKEYWGSENKKKAPIPSALLLSIYDEYSIAYKDRSDISDARDIERMIAMGNSLTSVIILAGKVAGGWSKSNSGRSVGIRLKLFRNLTEVEQQAIIAQAERYGKFFGLKVILAGI
jgi:hypothetical protein